MIQGPISQILLYLLITFNIVAMRNSTVQFSLFGACIFSSFPLVSLAQPILNAAQNSVISGNNNQVTQVINQTVIYRQNSGRSSFGKTGERRQGALEHSDRDQNEQGRRQRGDGRGRHKGDSDD